MGGDSAVQFTVTGTLEQQGHMGDCAVQFTVIGTWEQQGHMGDCAVQFTFPKHLEMDRDYGPLDTVGLRMGGDAICIYYTSWKWIVVGWMDSNTIRLRR